MPRSSTTWTARPPNSGKKKGKPSKKQLEIKGFFEEFFATKDYRDRLKERINKGKAMPIEALGYYYVYGKPKERVQLLGSAGEEMTHDDLITALVARFTRLASTRHIGEGTPQDAAETIGGTVLELERSGTTESTPAGGDVDGLAPIGGERVWESTMSDNTSSDADRMGDDGDAESRGQSI